MLMIPNGIISFLEEALNQLSTHTLLQAFYCIGIGFMAFVFLLAGNNYMAFKYCCRVKRLFPKAPGSLLANRTYSYLFKKLFYDKSGLVRIRDNRLLYSFYHSAEFYHIRNLFHGYGTDSIVNLRYPKPNDNPLRHGNLVIIKKYDPIIGEKGIIYLKFNESIKQFAALFNLERIAAHYRVVLEPSTWGYMEEDFHLLIGSNFDVVVQAQDEIDFQIIRDMNVNLVPIRIGAGDWIDTDIFAKPRSTAKRYDLIMIASWSRVKRHNVLFKALSQNHLTGLKVALIGYPWDNRTQQDVETEAARYGVRHCLDFFEKIPPQEVFSLIQQSRLALMLTKKEGANRGIYECLLAGVPVILYKYNRGVNKDLIIDSITGALADDHELGSVIESTLAKIDQFPDIAQWARQRIGRKIAHKKLDSMLRLLATQRQEAWQTSIAQLKTGHFPYVSDTERLALTSEYQTLSAYIR